MGCPMCPAWMSAGMVLGGIVLVLLIVLLVVLILRVSRS
jgi:hypothetical protein